MDNTCIDMHSRLIHNKSITVKYNNTIVHHNNNSSYSYGFCTYKLCVCDVGMLTCGCNNFKAIKMKMTLGRFSYRVSDNYNSGKL